MSNELKVTATNGTEFRLLKTKMSSMHTDDPHWAYRKDVCLSFKDGTDLPTAGPYSEGKEPREYWDLHGHQQGWTVFKNHVSISIGCMRFNGSQYKTLRKWALAK